MQADPEYLRQHYSSLPDEALLDIDRSDLVEIAQRCYDAEVIRRGLAPQGSVQGADGARTLAVQVADASAEAQVSERMPDTADEPEWLDEAAEVYSAVILARRKVEESVADARQALEAAGIPCHLEMIELTPEEKAPVVATHRWRLMVPARLNLMAMSTLERDLSNPDFEAGWRTHLEACSDDELSGMHPQIVFCDLFDRVERVTKAYEEEVARRRLDAESP